MRAHPILALPLLFAASPALAVPDTATLDVTALPGHPVRVTGTQVAGDGNSTSTTWVILSDNGQLEAVDVEPALRASASFVIARPGRHRIQLKCGNHIATVVSCTLTRGP